MSKLVLCVVFGLILSASAGPAVDSSGHLDNSVHPNEHTSSEEALLKKLNNKCSERDVSSCLMLKLVTYFNRMLKKSSIEFGDIAITQTSVETIKEDVGRSFSDANASEEEQVTQVLADKVWSFLRTRSLKWKMMDEADLVISGNSDKEGGLNLGFSVKPTDEAGEARKKKGGGMGAALLAAIAMKIGLLKALAFKALVLLVGKALLVSKLALVLAAIIGLKKLLHHEKHVTYEVVAHPHHEHHEHGFSSGGGFESHHGGWGRNFEAQDMAYKAHVPAN